MHEYFVEQKQVHIEIIVTGSIFWSIDSLCHMRGRSEFKSVISEGIFRMKFMHHSRVIALSWVSQNAFDDRFTSFSWWPGAGRWQTITWEPMLTQV